MSTTLLERQWILLIAHRPGQRASEQGRERRLQSDTGAIALE